MITPYIPNALDSFLQLTQAAIEDSLGNRLAWLKKLKGYYDQNELYSTALSADYYLGSWDPAMKSLRTCANRVVEFYVAKLEPGVVPDALPILTSNERIITPIQKVWLWSNLGSKKPVIIREFALYGDTFIKVNVNLGRDRVYMQFYSPHFVTDYDEDMRGNISSIRLDIPQADNVTYTEIWNMEGCTTYTHRAGGGATPDRMGAATVTTLKEMGIDFIPFSHAMFRDVGDKWGVGSFVPALEKIDEANRMVTRLHQMLFRYNKALWAVMANANDSDGAPIPAPRIGSGTGNLDITDDAIISLPGMSTMQSLVPDIKYADALAILQDLIHEIERDLPELAYFDLKTVGAISGKAVRELLATAIDRVIEARSNFESALIKADKMALTLGKVNQLEGFSAIGDYDKGEYDHQFTVRDVFPLTQEEKAQALTSLKNAGVPLALAMEIIGYSQDVIAKLPSDTPAA